MAQKMCVRGSGISHGVPALIPTSRESLLSQAPLGCDDSFTPTTARTKINTRLPDPIMPSPPQANCLSGAKNHPTSGLPGISNSEYNIAQPSVGYLSFSQPDYFAGPWDKNLGGLPSMATFSTGHGMLNPEGNLYPGQVSAYAPFSSPSRRGFMAHSASGDHVEKWNSAGEPMARVHSQSSTGSRKHRISKQAISRKLAKRATTFKMSHSGSPEDSMANFPGYITSSPEAFHDMDMSPIALSYGMMPFAPLSNHHIHDLGSPLHVNPAALQQMSAAVAGLVSHSAATSPHTSSDSTSPMSSPEMHGDTWMNSMMAQSDDHDYSSMLNLTPPCLVADMKHHTDGDSTSNCLTVLGHNDVSALSTGYSESEVRSHPYYKRPASRVDGNYHCPYEATCNHKPEKLKCNYDKYIDSHLKPYFCKVKDCHQRRFSSTACLLRHERETHAMHGHGDKPFQCERKDCDRSLPGKGFPRLYNLKDHVKRVHGPTLSNLAGSGASPSSPSAAASGAVATRRNSSASYKPRKRKQESSPGTSVVMSIKKESGCGPAFSPLAPKGTAAAPRTWHDSHKALETIVPRLVWTEGPNPLDNIMEAQHYLDLMKRAYHSMP